LHLDERVHPRVRIPSASSRRAKQFLGKINALKPLGKLRWSDEVAKGDYRTGISVYEHAVVETFTDRASMAESGDQQVRVIKGMIVYYFQKVTAPILRKKAYDYPVLTGEPLAPDGTTLRTSDHPRVVIVTAGGQQFLVASEEESVKLVPNARATFIGAGPLLTPARDE
jgi:hypothetical protein